MPYYVLNQVFGGSIFPEVTFVPPSNFAEIKSSLRTPGRHVTIFGASCTGKTTSAINALRDLKVNRSDIVRTHGFRHDTAKTGLGVLAKALACGESFDEITSRLELIKFVLIDDFHFLSLSAKREIAKLLKLWDEKAVSFVIIGEAGSAADLYGVDLELGVRNDLFEMHVQKDEFVLELLRLGEIALNIKFSPRLTAQIVSVSNCVPSVVQAICKACVLEEKLKYTVVGNTRIIDFDLKDLRESVLGSFNARYMGRIVGLAKGKRRSKGSNKMYFDILSCIARDHRSEIPQTSLYREIVSAGTNPDERKRKARSFNNCLNNLSKVIVEQGLEEAIQFTKGKGISIKDPTLRFYLNLVDIEEVGKR